MQFHSYEFILCFLPAALFLFFTVSKIWGKTAGNGVLALSSLVFYAFAGIPFLMILLLDILVNYILSLEIRKPAHGKFFLILGILMNTGLLLELKYTNFFLSIGNTLFHGNIPLLNLVLPLGISFFTFQQISYLVSAYRGELPGHSFLEYGVYILYFPKLAMGPLMEPAPFLNQLQDPKIGQIDFDHIASGIQQFTRGLFKKVLLADTFAGAVSWGFQNFSQATSADWMIIMLCYTFQLYFDFSGYTDMAIGISRMLNIQLPVNFNSPYQALSIRDFWKRWHMTLTGFLTKYIYIPLGGNRKGTGRMYLNMFLVFLVSGLWHGANWTFLLWGVLNAVFCILERMSPVDEKKIPAFFRWVWTFFLINILWCLFRAESVSQWWEILRTTFSFSNMTVTGELLHCFYLPEFQLLAQVFHMGTFRYLLSALVFLLGSFFLTLCCKNNDRREKKCSVFSLLGTIVLFVWSILSLSGDTVFLYSGF